jgi:hypothetical protein
VVPLRAEVDEDGATDVATDLRKRLDVGDGAHDGVTTHFVGQGALWAAMQELSKEDLAKAEAAGFPVVLLILLLVFGSFGGGGPAAGARVRLRARDRRADPRALRSPWRCRCS